MHNGRIWGWEIAVYLFLGGMAAGLMIVAALASRRVGPRPSRALRLLPFAAPLLLSIGMLALFVDLESKLHVFRFYTAFRITSPMSWGAWILLAVYPATLLLGAARLTDQEVAKLPAWLEAVARHGNERMAALERLNVVLGIALGAYTGLLLATLGARALWGSLLLAPLFLVSGFSAGAALAMLLPVSEEEHELLRKWDIRAIWAELALLAFFFIELVADGGERGRAAAALFLGGPYTAVFWALVIVAGLAAPLVVEIAEPRRRLARAALAPSLLLVGSLALRWLFVVAGQS